MNSISFKAVILGKPYSVGIVSFTFHKSAGTLHPKYTWGGRLQFLDVFLINGVSWRCYQNAHHQFSSHSNKLKWKKKQITLQSFMICFQSSIFSPKIDSVSTKNCNKALQCFREVSNVPTLVSSCKWWASQITIIVPPFV